MIENPAGWLAFAFKNGTAEEEKRPFLGEECPTVELGQLA
jgi:hypothetical protein